MGGCGQQEDVVVTEEDVVNRVKRSSSWKAAGQDGVRAFWFKTFFHCSLFWLRPYRSI